MVLATHGDFAKSLEYHRLGLLTLVYVAVQFLFRLSVLIFPLLAIRFSRFDSYLNRGLILLAVFFGINWIVTLIQFF